MNSLSISEVFWRSFSRMAIMRTWRVSSTRSIIRRKKELLLGQKVAIGAGFDDRAMRIEPTVLVDVDPDSRVMTEEIFAPILPVLTWRKLEEAIEFVRSRPKPLALYLSLGIGAWKNAC